MENPTLDISTETATVDVNANVPTTARQAEKENTTSSNAGKKATFLGLIHRVQKSDKLVLVVVYIALFLDYMLLTVIVPIMPDYLLRLDYPNMTYLLDGAQSTKLGRNNTERYFDNSSRYPASENETAHNEALLMALAATENVKIGLMFGSKALAQAIANQFIGPLTAKIGYSIPIFSGFLILLVSTLVYAFGTTYPVLVFARVMQGFGSACTATAGFGILATRYKDDRERGNAIAIAVGGGALGVVLGPTFGGVLYHYGGKMLPFVLLAALTLVDGLLLLFALKLRREPAQKEASSMLKLIKDPYIDVSAGGILVGNLGVSVLEVALPLWMLSRMGANPAVTGLTYLALTIGYLVGTSFLGPITFKLGRWRSGLLGLAALGVAIIAIPFPMIAPELIPSLAVIGLAQALVDVTMFAIMGNLAETRHCGAFGGVYAISDTAMSVAFIIGPYAAGGITEHIGFPAMMFILGAIMVAYSPFFILLRNPPARVVADDVPKEPLGPISSVRRKTIIRL